MPGKKAGPQDPFGYLAAAREGSLTNAVHRPDPAPVSASTDNLPRSALNDTLSRAKELPAPATSADLQEQQRPATAARGSSADAAQLIQEASRPSVRPAAPVAAAASAAQPAARSGGLAPERSTASTRYAEVDESMEGLRPPVRPPPTTKPELGQAEPAEMEAEEFVGGEGDIPEEL